MYAFKYYMIQKHTLANGLVHNYTSVDYLFCKCCNILQETNIGQLSSCEIKFCYYYVYYVF